MVLSKTDGTKIFHFLLPFFSETNGKALNPQKNKRFSGLFSWGGLKGGESVKDEKKGENKPKKELTPKQKKFAAEYVKNGGNAAEAYRAAGYESKSAKQNARRLKKNPDIQANISRLAEPAEAADIADAQEVLRYLTAVLRGENVSETVIIEGTGKGKSKARAVERHPEEKERLEAAKTLAKIKGMYTNNVDIGGVFVKIVDDIPTGDDET